MGYESEVGGGEFVSSDIREWRVNFEKVGMVGSKNRFTFATADGAGHMIYCLEFSLLSEARCHMISQRKCSQSFRGGWQKKLFKLVYSSPR